MPTNSRLKPLAEFWVAVRRNLRFSLLVLWLVTSPLVLGHVALVVAQEAGHQTEGHGESADAEHDAGWWPTIQRAINFGLLAGVLWYFGRKPARDYLAGRGETIRKDLIDAKSLRGTSEQQLAEVRERLSRLPREIDALQRRGQEELAQERVRLAEATAQERDRVLERTRREIDMHFRTARRALLEQAADLSITMARTKIERDITAEDQARLIDRYASEVRP